MIAANEYNNIKATQYPVNIVSVKDLTVTSVSGSSASRGGSIPITCTIARASAPIPQNFIVRFLLSTDNVFQSTDIMLGDATVYGLNLPSLTFTRSFTVPTWIAARTYYIIAYVDRLNSITEADENNNIKASASRVNIT